MSMKLMAMAMEIRVGNPLRKLVLLKLCDNANDKGECWPSFQHIADLCEISRRSAINHIQALENEGFIKSENRFKSGEKISNFYIISLEKKYAISSAGDALGGSATNSPPSATDSPGSAGDALGGSAGDAHRTSHSSEPVKESVIKKINKKDLAEEVFDFWKATMSHSKAHLDEKRFKLITKSLDLGYSVEDLKSAIVGCAKSEYHMGKNENGTVYDDLGLILRDAGKIDGFIKKSTQVISHETSQFTGGSGGSGAKVPHADLVRGQAQRAFERRHGGHGVGSVRPPG